MTAKIDLQVTGWRLHVVSLLQLIAIFCLQLASRTATGEWPDELNLKVEFKQ